MISLARFPKVQEKLYKILEVQDFRADEFKDCHFLQAVIYECYRYFPAIYRSLAHSITEKTEIMGETFEKDELICFGIAACNLNEKYFKVGLFLKILLTIFRILLNFNQSAF